MDEIDFIELIVSCFKLILDYEKVESYLVRKMSF